MKTDYTTSVMHYRLIDGGHIRVGMDSQLVYVETHLTAASSQDAHAFVDKHVVNSDRAAVKRLTYPPNATKERYINRDKEA
jgi:hypothetical protein